jgi:ADP-ribosylglycohydrolase
LLLQADATTTSDPSSTHAHTAQAFLRTYGRGLRPPATGADDAQADCIARLAPLVAAYAGDDRLMQLVSAATRVTQGAPTAVAWACAAAAVLERLLQGATAAAAVADTVQELRQQHELQQGGWSSGVRAGMMQQQGAATCVDNQSSLLLLRPRAGRMPIDAQLAAEVADHMHRVLQLRDVPHAEAVEQLGRNCHLPNSCQTPLHAVLHHEWRVSAQAGIQQQLLVAAVRDALAAGGCCASRAGFVGACIGAMQGVECVPPDWRRRYEAAAEVQRHADALCTARGGVMGGL